MFNDPVYSKFAHRTSTTPPSLVNEMFSDLEISGIIKDSASDAMMISNRINVKANRKERIGIFTNCLRKRISGNNRELFSVLVNTIFWYDIGVLDPSCENWRFGIITRNKVNKWLEMANISKPEEFDLQESFNELSRSVAIMNNMVDVQKDINNLGDKLIDNLCQIFELGEK